MTRRKPEQSVRSRRAAAADELAMELIALRATLKEMVERYQVRVGGQLEELIEAVSGDPTLERPPRLPTLRRIAAMEKVLRSIALKPQKGRAKDFARLQASVAKMMEVLEE